MKQTDGAKKQLELLLQRYPILAGQRDEIDGAYQIIAASYEAGGKLLIAGNGGSAADAEHIVGELTERVQEDPQAG
ncbi:MAG: SIS domain-containing protein [Faecalibacterium prausnitzii]